VPMGAVTIASLVYQTVWVASITFGIWFALIAVYSPTTLSVVTFLTPLFGAALGYFLLDELLGAEHVFALLAVATGIFLVSLPKSRQRAATARDVA